jgi:ATP-binding cassette subfamily F protein uup
LLLLDEPTNDLDIPALEVLEESLAEFPGALVLVSHDRELLDRICTEVVGLDGRGGAAVYASVSQWLTEYEWANAEAQKATVPSVKTRRPVAAGPKASKRTYREQKEWEQMEGAILQAEETLATRQAAVESAEGPHSSHDSTFCLWLKGIACRKPP